MKLKVLGFTDTGLKRDNNQDSFLVDEKLGLYIVADGMGGHQGGEVASQLTAQVIKNVVQESFDRDQGVKPSEILQRAYSLASAKVFEKSLENIRLKGMGTTAVTALVRENKLYIANVGDSRVYLVRPPHIWQLTEDHSLLNEQIKAGLIRAENIPLFAAKNVITRSVGFEEHVTCDIIEREIQPGDYFLMCSDGLSGLVSDKRIVDVILTLSFHDVGPRLIEEAKRHGGDDNITVLVMQAQGRA